ncbi:MAG: CHAT domain-containing protein [Myxococcota bacterium]
MLHVLLLLPLLGCDMGLPDLGELLGTNEPVAATPAGPAAKDTSAQVADIRAVLRSGKAADAAKAAEALLAAHPEEDAVWELVELAAIRGGVAGELVDRLSADQAIGGRVDRHHALRGVLAVEANRLGDAINAARALRPVAPGDAAAIFALATAKGAPTPDDLTPAEKGLLAARSAGVGLDAQVEALPGWRVALVRAEARLARGDRAGAALEAAVAEAGGPRARGLGSLVRIRAAATADEAWAAAESSARAALEEGDALGVAEILDAVLPVALGGWKASVVATAATELRGKLTDAGNGEAAARVAVVEAEAALRAGMPVRAREAARLAVALPALSVRASWTLALTSAALGLPADVDAAASALAEPRAGAARDLAKALRGQSPTLPSPGLEGADAAHQALLGAGWLADPRAAYATAALAAEPLAPDLAAWARLAVGDAPVALTADATPSLRAEHAARAWLASGVATPALPGDLPHPGATGWNALFAGTPAAADAPGIAAWSRLRAALDAADTAAAAKELGALSIVVPAWRTGPWAPIARLDGPRPEDLDADAARSARGADPLPFAVVHHGWDARVQTSELRWSRGIAPFPPTATPEQRAAVWDAAAAHRAGVVAAFMGHGTWPAAAATTLEEAEKAAGLARFAPPSLAALRTTLDGDAIVSFRIVPNGVETLYVGEEKGKLALLPASLPRDTGAMLASLRAGESVVAQGDRLRETVIDGAMDVLLGVGRYMVVGPAPVGLLPIAAMPEQADGLRFLASIRHVGYLPDLDSVLPPVVAVEPEMGMTLFALCADPVESLAVRRVYPDAQVLEGPAATVAAFRANAGTARFVHVGGFPVTADGGFQLADGPLTLGDIAALPLQARGVLIGGGQDPAVIAGRIAAFRQAGATDVMVEGWSIESDLRGPILMHFWEGLNRRYSASRSLSEARTLALREVGEASVPPASWGGFFVSGRP